MQPPHIRLKSLRDNLGYTQEEMADTLGMPQSRYCAIERGRTGIPAWGLVAIAAMEYLSNKRLLKLFFRWMKE